MTPPTRQHRFSKPPVRLLTTTLWEYPSQHYDAYQLPGSDRITKSQFAMQGSKDYIGATPSWVIWQCLVRYTREKDLIVDPMCGSGTTIDVCKDLGRRFLGYDLSPSREDIFRADARKLPLEDGKADFVFIDPPYSTHVDYSEDERDIGRLDAAVTNGVGERKGQGPETVNDYYAAMDQVIREIHRVLKDRRYMALYVSDSWRKRAPSPTGGKGGAAGDRGTGTFMPIGFELFARMKKHFKPIDIITVVRHNQKLQRGNWRKAAEEGNFFLRGFNYLFIMKKEESAKPQ